MDTKINTTGEKVEARPVAWRWKGHDSKWIYEEGNRIKREMREYDGVAIEDLYSAATIAALVAERDEWKDMFEQCNFKHGETIKRVNAANARVARLEHAATILLSEIDAPGGREEIIMATSSLRAALTGGQ